MGDQAVGEGARYRAFISYSHKDAAFGRWLHRRLEAYLIPQRLVGRASLPGAVPRRLVPIFRDREELPAANDLSTEVQAALQDSASLIVVCSREAAASKWVSREVDLFRALHPGRPVLAAIRSGEPPDCFPQSLLRHSASGEAIEPLAADFRRSHDGEQIGLLKLIAGMVGIGLDELIQRDAQRRLQRVTAITALAFVAVLVMSALTIVALNARTEAERQRGQAEGLVEFMLTDLRDRLKGVGRLDVMSAVNERALRYYADQNIGKLAADSLERRARILHAMGEDDEARGDYDAALIKFHESERTTGALLAAAPNNPDRVFDHAQSEYYLGEVDYQRKRYSSAQDFFEAYKRLADRLLSLAPRDPRSAQEVGFAKGDLCTNALKIPKEFGAAIRLCTEALHDMENAAGRSPPSATMMKNLANRHSWLASAYLASGDHANASVQVGAEDKFLDALLRADPKSMINKMLWVSLQRQSAWIEAKLGKVPQAKARLAQATSVLNAMIEYEPHNENLHELRKKIDDDLKQIDVLPAPKHLN